MNRRSLLLSLVGVSLCGGAARADDRRVSGLSRTLFDLDPTALDVAALQARFLRQNQRLDELERRIKAARWIGRQPHLPREIAARIADGPNHAHGPWCVHFYESGYILEPPRQPMGDPSAEYVASVRRQVQEQLVRIAVLEDMVEVEERSARARLFASSG